MSDKPPFASSGVTVSVCEHKEFDPDCWCRPRLASVCPECAEMSPREAAKCVTCGGGGLVDADPENDETAVIVIHRDLVSKCCLSNLQRRTDELGKFGWLECVKCGHPSGTYELVEGD